MWIENDAFVPSPGDFVFYDWKDNGVGDCVEGHDHVGIVEFVNNGEITVMEGNKSGAFGRRVIKINGRYIRGFAHLTFDDETSTHASKEVTPLLEDIAELLSELSDKLKELGEAF